MIVAQFHGELHGFTAREEKNAVQMAKEWVAEQLPQHIVPLFRKTSDGLSCIGVGGYWTITEVEFADADSEEMDL